MLANPIGLIVVGIALLIAGVASVIYWWDDLTAAFLDTSWGQAIMTVIDGLLGYLKNLINPIEWIADKFSSLFGLAGDVEIKQSVLSSSVLDAPRRGNLPPGGVTKHISNTIASSQNNQRTIGQVVIHTDQPMDAQALDELLFKGA